MRLLFTVLLSLYSTLIFACTGGSNAGTLNPTAAYQTQSVSNGQYYVINVNCGYTYNFTFCSNGGSAAWDTQITINQTDNTTQLAYNDDACGLQSNVSWNATFTGTVHVLISQYNCNNGGGNSATLAYNATPISTTVNYNAGCTTASPVVTGVSGGTFSFNPAPGDAATINPSTGLISNATEGASYTVDYMHCAGTVSAAVNMGTAPCWSLNGNAQWITVSGDDCIQLTAEVNNQTGCAWSDSQIDFAGDFSLTLDYYFGNNINGADGNTFTFQPSSSTACGQNGGQLGAGGIANALSIEFDTYDNDNPSHIYDMSCDHVAIETDGNMMGPGAPLCGPVCAKSSGGNIDDGGVYTVDIVWNAATTTLEIYFDGNLRLSCVNDFVTNTFGGNSEVYWGATSATGGLNNQQYFCPSTVVVLPTELLSFESICTGEEEILKWVSASEHRTNYFQIEYTYDGLLYHPIGQLQAAGESNEVLQYELTVPTTDTKQRYYRMKMVDLDGAFSYSSIIASSNCANTSSLIGSWTQANNLLKVVTTESCNLQLYTTLGQEINSSNLSGKNFQLDLTGLSSGIYLLKAVSLDGQAELQRIFIR